MINTRVNVKQEIILETYVKKQFLREFIETENVSNSRVNGLCLCLCCHFLNSKNSKQNEW